MPFSEIFDETLDINTTANYLLSLQIDIYGVSYAVLDSLRSKFIMLRSFEPEESEVYSMDEINSIISGDDFLRRKFKSVQVVLNMPKFTLVPAPLFEPEKKEVLFGLNHVNGENEKVVVNRLKNPDAYNLFSVPSDISGLLDFIIPGKTPDHYLKPLILNIIQYSGGSQHNHIQLHIERCFFTLIVMNHDILKFCNSFEYKSVNDILYYLLNVCDTMGIDNENTIHCSGVILKRDEIYNGLSEYFKNILFLKPAGNFSFSYVFDEVDLHRYLNLFSIISCE